MVECSAPVFIVMGNYKYYRLLELCVRHISKAYPEAEIIAYDWGDEQRRSTLAERLHAPHMTVVDWAERINDIEWMRRVLPFAMQVDLALRFNARFQRTFAQRVKKKLLKVWPSSLFARPSIDAGLRFENFMMQKIYCINDAAQRVGARKMVFVDADAFVLSRFDEMLQRDDYDVAVTASENPCFDHNHCTSLNTGVIFFGSDAANRQVLLQAWLNGALECHEWLREQTALARLIERTNRAFFTASEVVEAQMDGATIRLLPLDGNIYNNGHHDCLDHGQAPKVVHLVNTAHNDLYFNKLAAKLAAV